MERARFELPLVLVLLLGLLAAFLWAAEALQRDVERYLVDAEVMNLRTSLQLDVASAIARGNEAALAAWVDGEPLRPFAAPAAPPIASPGGATLTHGWHWRKGGLEYTYPDGQRERLTIVRNQAGGREAASLGGGLLLVRDQIPPP